MTAGSVAAPLIIPIMPLHMSRGRINTHTPVSLHSDSPGVDIFFTLDGSKPVWGQRGAANSRKYKEHFLLPAGRVVVRAMAVSSDGRESSTVTKVFVVDDVEPPARTEEAGEADPQQAPPPLAPQTPRRPPQAPADLPRPSGASLSPDSARLRLLWGSNRSRLHRQMDFMRCAHCLCCRPSDPSAQFCPQCGAVVPPLPGQGQRLPPTEEGQALRCVWCHAVAPVNSSSCVVCEAPVRPQLQPQAHLCLQGQVECVSCGCLNPVQVSRCVMCENLLPGARGGASSGCCVQSQADRKLSCSRCKRTNGADARFCSWCGAKPGHALACVLCRRCGASVHPYAFHCTACGSFLEAPIAPSPCNDTGSPTGGAADRRQTFLKASWQAVPPSDSAPSESAAPPTADKHTQTVGLFYPSSAQLSRKDQQRALELSRRQQATDRQAPLSSISPGRGYWRKQLDHVCAHLRSYAQNSAPFRAVLGEPRLGRMLSAVMSEDGEQVSLTVCFTAASRHRAQLSSECEDLWPAGGSTQPEGLSSVTERSGLGRTPAAKEAQETTDACLLRELGPGRGQLSAVRQLLDQGADPSCRGPDGRPALMAAVENGHHQVIPVLVQRGADIHQRSGRMKNSALHQAAALGAEGLQSARVLLSCGASASLRNGAGQTPCHSALSSGCDATTALLTSHAQDRHRPDHL